MELKTIFSNIKSSNKNVIWLTVINGVIIQKVYITNGWQIVSNPSSSNSLYGEYVNNGRSNIKEEFNEALFNLIV